MRKTILVVDDEHGIADTMAAILDHAGYTSIAAYDAAAALAVLQTTSPDLIISDVVMPGMNGLDLAVEAASLCPSAKILLISGNAATQEMVETAHIKGHTFQLMAKPVLPRDLLAAVGDLLRDAA